MSGRALPARESGSTAVSPGDPDLGCHSPCLQTQRSEVYSDSTALETPSNTISRWKGWLRERHTHSKIQSLRKLPVLRSNRSQERTMGKPQMPALRPMSAG